ncbi:MAG: Fur family transcriptional regulator [Gammaproteobacteria bacterium]
MSLPSSIEVTLRAHGVQPTPRRIEIGQLLLAGPGHFSADQILQQLRSEGSRISKATVYNTLNLFSRAGIIREVAVNPSRLVYDSTTTRHHHFLIEDTGELVDIDPSEVELRQLPCLPEGTHAASVEVIIRVRRTPS